MTRTRTLAWVITMSAGCASHATPSPSLPAPACSARPESAHHFVVDELERDDTQGFVWGAADLHAHPAGHLALGGQDDGTGGVLWGRPDTDHPGTLRQEHGRIWLGPGDSCDGETHLRATPDVAARLTQSLVFSFIGDEGNRAHSAMYGRPGASGGTGADVPTTPTGATCTTPRAEVDAWIGDAGHPDAQVTDGGVPNLADAAGPTSAVDVRSPFGAWPHAQDLYHQQMYVEMLRRAWEGGLRMMFASIQENQSLATIMGISLAPGPLALDPQRDVVSVERQLAFIENMVRENEDFLRIVTTPREARDAIRQGRLALVLSVEIDWLPLDVVRRLHDEHGVVHIVPIHLADNPVGGTAAYTPVFNMHSALFQRALGAPGLAYFQLTRDECIARRPQPPLTPSLDLGLLFLPNEMDTAPYFALGYESCDTCAAPSPRTLDVTGSRNATGVTRMSHIRALMRMGMLVDVVHMSIASALDTMQEAEHWGYPLLDTHTGVSRAGHRVGQDRELPLAIARRIYRNQHGIVGLGTGPHGAVVRPLYAATGAPLVMLSPGATQALPTPTVPPSARCTTENLAALPDDARICVSSNACGGALGMVRVRACDGSAEDYDITDGCTPVLTRPAERGVELIQYRQSRDPWCTTAIETRCSEPNLVDAGTDDANGLVIDARIDSRGTTLCSFALPLLPAGATRRPDTDLAAGLCPARTEGCFGDEGTPADAVSVPAVVPGRHVIRVRAMPHGGFANRVRGGSAFYTGADVIVRLVFADAAHTSLDVSLNHRGLWVGDGTFTEYRVIDVDAPLASVSISMSNDDPRPHGWSLDTLTIDEVEDPILAWAREYAAIRDEIARAGTTATAVDPVVMAIGTDQNGFAPQFPISGLALDRGDCDPFQVCSTETGECAALRMAERGVADYAMLAEFLSALGTADRLLGHDAAHSVQDAVFSSADALVRTWEIAEIRAASVPP